MDNLFYLNIRDVFFSREEMSKELALFVLYGLEPLDTFAFMLDDLDGFKLADESHLVENFIRNYLNSPYNVDRPLTDKEGRFTNDSESVYLDNDTEELLFSIARRLVAYLEHKLNSNRFDWFIEVAKIHSRYFSLAQPNTLVLIIREDKE